MSQLLVFDQQLFFVINHLPHNFIFNLLALLVSGVGTFGIIFFVLGMRFWKPLFLSGVGSWLIAEVILKPLFARPRPDASAGFAFPSGHATIAFAMATVLSKKVPKWRFALFLLATAIAISRIYLGKHYPLDILVGAFLGIIIGWLSLMLASFVPPKSTWK